jgi:Xaa-Pro aminopeptidase
MDRGLFMKRVADLRERLMDLPCDTLWIVQSENRRYLSGFEAEDTQIDESSGSLLITGERCVLATDSRYTTEAEAQARDFEVFTLKEGFVKGFSDLVKALGTRILGFEEAYVTCGLHRELSEALTGPEGNVALEPLNGIVEQMREVKDENEIQAMQASADLICGVLGEIIPWMKAGMREKEVAWQIEGLARDGRADRMAFPSIVASGPNSALPHVLPTDREIREGEPVILDVGVRLKGYCSDMTRTIFLGEPDADMKNIYMTVRRAQQASLKEVKSGVESDYPDQVARQIISDAGYGDYFGHGLGHGVGLATHERPRLSPLKPTILKQGTVVTVEPGIYLPGSGGVRLEEMVAVERDGPRVLTKDPHFYEFDG